MSLVIKNKEEAPLLLDYESPFLRSKGFVILCVVGAFLVGLILAIIALSIPLALEISKNKDDNKVSGPTIYRREFDTCGYSSRLLVDISYDAIQFYAYGFGNTAFVYSSQTWSDFIPFFSDVEHSIYNNSTFVDSTSKFQSTIASALSDTSLLTTERLSLSELSRDVNFALSLVDQQIFHLNYGSYENYALVVDPSIIFYESAKIFLKSPQTYQTQPNFESSILQWLQNYLIKAESLTPYYVHVIETGKTHANVTNNGNYRAYYSALVNFSSSDLCTLLKSPSANEQCLNLTRDITDVNLALYNFYNTTYWPACAKFRPDDKPGLHYIQNGTEAYAIFMAYHLGYTDSPTRIYNLGLNLIDQMINSTTTLTGLSWNDSVLYLSNTSDPNLFISGQNSSTRALSYYSNTLQNILKYINTEFAYFTRGNSFIRTVNYIGAASWQNGYYDPIRKMFLTPAYFNLAPDGIDSEGNWIFKTFNAIALTLHEIFPGHGQQVPLSQEVDCKISPNSSSPNSFVEGFALYTEQFGYWIGDKSSNNNNNSKGLYEDTIQELGYLNANMMRSNRLAEDTGLHDQGWSFERAASFMEQNGFVASMARAETARYITMPGQALGYMLGKLKLMEMRENVQKRVGGKWSAVEFNMLITKFGGGTLEDLESLTKTYGDWKSGDGKSSEEAEKGFGYDLISEQMFGSCLPVVGYGRRL